MKKFIIFFIIIASLTLGCSVIAIVKYYDTETITDLTTGIRYENVKAVYYRGAVTFEYNGKTYHLSNYMVE